MGKYIFLIIVLIVIAVAIVNVVTQLKGSWKFENLSSFLKLNYQAPSAMNNGTPSVSGGTSTAKRGGSSPPSHPISQTPTKPTVTPPPGFTADELSPYYGQIKIGSFYITTYGPSHISLYASYNMGSSTVDVSGWEIESNKGKEFLIPQAVADFTPLGFGDNADIVLGSGGRLDIYNGASPINRNLKINECMGYLNSTYKFTPTLQCGYISMYDHSEISSFSGKCQNYILSLGSCRVPTPNDLNSFVGESTCRSFLQRFSYTGCYNLQRNSPNFFTNNWIAWIPSPWSFDQSHDRVFLLDKNGLLVNQYIY